MKIVRIRIKMGTGDGQNIHIEMGNEGSQNIHIEMGNEGSQNIRIKMDNEDSQNIRIKMGNEDSQNRSYGTNQNIRIWRQLEQRVMMIIRIYVYRWALEVVIWVMEYIHIR